MKSHLLLIERKIYEDPLFQGGYQLGRYLTEAKLSAAQVQQVFAAVEQGAASGGNVAKAGDPASSNRTMLGKGADVVGKVGKFFDTVKDKISKSGPVAGFDATVDSLQGQLIQASGGEQGKVSQAINKYREFAKAHPVMQGAIYAGLIALAGISGAGLGGAAILGGIKVFDRLLQGDKASSALWKGFKTGALAYGASKLLNQPAHADPTTTTVTPNVEPPMPPAPDVTNVVPDVPQVVSVNSGDTLSQIAQAHQTSVKALMQANPGITNPDALQIGTQVTIPPINSTTYMGGVGTASDTAAKVASGAYQTKAAALAAQNAALRSGYENPNKAINEWVDRDRTVRTWALNESIGKPRTGVFLTSAGVSEVCRRVDYCESIDEGVWDAVKGAGKWVADKGEAIGQGIGKAVKTGWHDATNKITANRLDVNFRRGAGRDLMTNGSVDSKALIEFLKGEGVQDGLIQSVFKSMGIPMGGKSGGKVKGQVSQTANAQRKRAARAAKKAGAQPQAAPGGAPAQPQAAPGGATAAKMAGIKPQPAPTPNYGRQASGYGSQTTSFKSPGSMPTNATNATLGGAQNTQPAKPAKKKKAPAPAPATAAAEHRMYGGKYIREGADEKLAREFEHFLKHLG
jgi:hypothetical protein